ncbi:MAG: mannosyl-3-phosphoglycerate phosphatase [unclassified Hahellaceae]|nr:mannosyl-3-phosphoglycerate phosphatase [Hahellaceae bacterium]|tara:strand:- start:26943 stop:27791 length:849 start_codon:yes stop_codon:yes gene_type:complete
MTENQSLQRRLLIYTDLDGTLLDHDSYDTSATAALRQNLKALGVPVVWNTSKTAAELEALRVALDHTDPYIVENGAALYFPDESTQQPKQTFGPGHDHIMNCLEGVKGRFRFKGFHDMTTAEVAAATGLAEPDAALAKQRQFSEPLTWQDSPAAMSDFLAAMADCGLTVLRGGRFVHILGNFNKATPMRWLNDYYANRWNAIVETIALGDSQNDIAMLQAADRAYLIRSPAHVPPQINGQANIRIAKGYGPNGWAEAISSEVHTLVANDESPDETLTTSTQG